MLYEQTTMIEYVEQWHCLSGILLNSKQTQYNV